MLRKKCRKKKGRFVTRMGSIPSEYNLEDTSRNLDKKRWLKERNGFCNAPNSLSKYII